MNTTIRIPRSQTVQINMASIVALLARLVASLPRLTAPADDPAAKRYAASKYNGEID